MKKHRMGPQAFHSFTEIFLKYEEALQIYPQSVQYEILSLPRRCHNNSQILPQFSAAYLGL